MRSLKKSETGSTLALVPVAVVILLLLLSLTLDATATFMAQRQLADACAAAANDAAVVALRPAELYGSSGRSERVVDRRRAIELGHARAEPLELAWETPIHVDASVDGPTVAFTLSADAPVPVGRPRGRARAHVTASCRATSIRR